jgi:hypothetical protein
MQLCITVSPRVIFKARSVIFLSPFSYLFPPGGIQPTLLKLNRMIQVEAAAELNTPGFFRTAHLIHIIASHTSL